MRSASEPACAISGALVVLWVVVPLGSYVVLRPNVYDGMRHFLFVLPGLALLAALGAHRLIEATRGRRVRALVAAGLVAGLAWPIPGMVELHPYQSSYFNVFVGGLRGAAGRYETDYWASSYKEGMEWIRDRASGRPVRVLVAATGHSQDAAAAYAADGVELSFTFRGDVPGPLPEDVDYYLATTRWRKDRNFPEAPIVHRIGRQGAVFAVVRGR